MVKSSFPRSWSDKTPLEYTDPDIIQNYLYDESRIIRGSAYRIILPWDESQIAHILSKANENDYRVTISGAGTGITGSRVPLGGVVVSMENMTMVSKESPGKERVVKYGSKNYLIKYYKSDEDDSFHIVAPVGMPVDVFIQALDELSLVYPPEPTEKLAFLGGNLSTHASGKWSFRFGPLRKYIYRLRLVLPSGQVIDVKRGEYTIRKYIEIESKSGSSLEIPVPLLNTPNVIKSSAWPNIRVGDDLVDFLIGMEGILGVYTEVEYRLPPKPKNIYSLFTIFQSEDDAVNTVEELRRRAREYGIWAVEYIDYESIELIRHKLRREFPLKSGGGILYIDVAGGDDIFDLLTKVSDLLESYGAVETYASDDPRWMDEAMRIRHMVPENINNFLSIHGMHKVASDASVPFYKLRDALELYREVGEESGVNYVIFGHIGDAHLHFNFLPRNNKELQRSMHYMTYLLKRFVGWGGSVTAEHGFGKKKYLDEDGIMKPLIRLQYGEEGEEMVRDLKSVIDPKSILNVGNIAWPKGFNFPY